MRKENLKHFTVFALLFICINTMAQNESGNDSTFFKKVRNIVPKVAIGMSRHFITEVGIAHMRSNFINHKNFGLNTKYVIYYAGLEIMTPYKKPLTYGYKAGVETMSFGHSIGGGGLEMIYYVKDTNTSVAIIPKIGLPLVNGMLSYGFTMFTNSSMRKEVGRHRVTLTYCFNRKSDKVLQDLWTKYTNRRR
jgi:hypothetical protein